MTRFLFKQLNDFLTAAGTSRQLRADRVICSLVIIVAMIGTIDFACAADGLPGQDQALALALENHPDIVAAKAKVALAQAELYGKRTDVTRQVLGLYGGLKTLDAQIAQVKASLIQSKEESERANNAGAIDPSTKQKLTAAAQAFEGQLVQATGQREQAEKELRLLIGAAPRAKEEKLGIATAIPARQAPQGPIVDTWEAKAEQPIKISFTDMPLTEVASFLSTKTGIMFSLQRQALEDAGESADQPISLSTDEVPLRAALQAFQDTYPQLQFVLRDYGVLLTTKDYAQEHGYMPVVPGDEAGSGGEGGGTGFF